MIILDTHIWIWWVDGDSKLPQNYYDFISEREADGLGVCAISCWETAKLVELGRLPLPLPVSEWLAKALDYPGVRLLPLSPEIAVESTQLPGTFHRDPADQIIVATARLYRCPLVTVDANIRAYFPRFGRAMRNRRPMKKIISTLTYSLLLAGYSAIAGPPSTPSYKPANGYAPDAKTAIRIAVAVWSPIYGEQRIQGEKPFHASLKRGVWTVTGSMPPSKPGVDMFGGVALARISKADGRILQIIHGK